MALAFDSATRSGAAASGTNLTFAHTCSGSNRLLFVGMIVYSGGDLVTGVTYNGVAMSEINQVTSPAGYVQNVWLLVGPASGTNNVVATLSGTGDRQGYAVSYTGALQTGQPDNNNTNTTTATTITATLTTIADNCWAVMFLTNNAANLDSTGTNFVLRTTTDSSGFGDTGGPVTPAGSLSMIASNGGNNAKWGANIVSFSPAATSQVKTWDGIAQASVKTFDGLANASTKTVNGVTNA